MMYINGHWVNAVSGSFFPVHNPSNNEKIGEAADGNQDDARQAIEAAPGVFWGAKAAKKALPNILKPSWGAFPYNKSQIQLMLNVGQMHIASAQRNDGVFLLETD